VVTVAPGLLLDHDRVGSLREHAARENARRFAVTDRKRKRPAGGDFADNLQAHRRIGDIGGTHGVAVHCRHVGRRLRAPRLERVGEDAVMRLVERRLFGRQRRRVLQHAFERVSD
jgi:hypothetical protein